jgi:hypothetical protein
MLEDGTEAAGDTKPFYTVDAEGKTFSFRFDDPAELVGQEYVYNSSSSTWTLVKNKIVLS